MQIEQPLEELTQRINHCKDVLRQAGIKLTHQRIEIFREIAQTIEHPDAETVYNGVRTRIPTISLDTVYRTLVLFTDLGLISSLKEPHERMRFDANMQTHHHFVCTECGMIRDFVSTELDTLSIPNSVQEFGTVRQTHVEVRGLCWSCAKTKIHGE